MITFKKFLEELQHDDLQLDDAINIIKTRCKNAVWMILGHSPIYRGDKQGSMQSDYMIIDPSKTERQSAHTSNHYTLILDNIPSMKGYPKRSKSLICTTEERKAMDFSGNGSPYIVIPFDNVDIGVVNSSDMWDVEIELFDSPPREIDRINRFWRELGLPAENGSWSKWIEFAEQCVGPDKETCQKRIQKAVNNTYPDILKYKSINAISSDFLGLIDKAYSPKATGVTKCDTSDKYDFDRKTEVWIGGPCLMLTKKAWYQIVEHFTQETEE